VTCFDCRSKGCGVIGVVIMQEIATISKGLLSIALSSVASANSTAKIRPTDPGIALACRSPFR
jgi:hypothetical protein